jgi:hypothetical protein
MKFSDHLGLDADLVFNIVAHASGASAAFLMGFEQMRREYWSLKAIFGVDGIRDRLVSIYELYLGYQDKLMLWAQQMLAIDKASKLQYPLHLSCAALQQYHLHLHDY